MTFWRREVDRGKNLQVTKTVTYPNESAGPYQALGQQIVTWQL